MMKGNNKSLYAHEILKSDFYTIHEEAKRQENIDPRNKGEVEIAIGVFKFFNDTVIPLLISEPWVYNAALAFADQHIQNYFLSVRLLAEQSYKYQINLQETNKEVVNIVMKMTNEGKSQVAGEIHLAKASDFTKLILFEKLTPSEIQQVNDIYHRVLDQEQIQVTLTLKNIRELYEMGIPRIMFVAQRAIKHTLGLKPAKSNGKLLQPSDYLDWFSKKVDESHYLFPIIGSKEIQKFFKIARNVGSHHIGIKRDQDNNIVILEDRYETLELPLYQFQQRYRYLVYMIDYGTRAILSAFCEVEKGEIANKVFKEYNKTFPVEYPSDINFRPYLVK
ncbi:MAG: hypothetical protein JXB38_03585 [Anaerolineales bacterium]|nr:hypothetical protein [Anaerolineales bacterium]